MLYYDQLNRLTGASGYAFTEQGITYDKNGNIKTLQRTANNSTVENLSYVYSGNKLSSVNETVTGGMTSTYTYDANGNLANDSKKALNFSYNFLNLLSTAGTTNYCYAADGTKLAVRDASGNGFAYLGSLILSPSSTEFQFSGGVIRKTTSGYEVNYFLRDHLGSVRTVVNAAGEVVQQSDYYPFGSKHENATYANNSNRFLYSGKELQTTGNLGFLDYGARMYDAKLGRWFVQDPMSEKYPAFSPYDYVLNNPINAIDPDGNIVIFINGFHTGNGGTSKYWNGFDNVVMTKFNDNNVIYRDGSLGGIGMSVNRQGVFTYNLSQSLTIENRVNDGYNRGKIDAIHIINGLKRDKDNNVIESIKIVSHSMGAAYAKGYIKAIVEYMKEHSDISNGIQITEYSFAGYQQNQLSAINGVSLFQYDNKDDQYVGGWKGSLFGSSLSIQNGAEERYLNSNGGHSVDSFMQNIMNLPEGRYKYINGGFVKQ